jgi:hypothetical protein
MSDQCHLVMLLDESGSMHMIRNDIIGSVNKFVEDQQNLKEDNTTFTLIKFATESKTILDKKSLKEVSPLTKDDYCPDGWTALYDAICNAILLFKDEKNVVVIVVTDGGENSSREYRDLTIVNAKIQEKVELGWKYIYLNSGLQAREQVRSFGVRDNSELSASEIAIGTMSGQATQGCCCTSIGKTLASGCSDAVSKYRVNGIMPVIQDIQ